MKAKIITKEIMENFYEKDGWLYWKKLFTNKCRQTIGSIAGRLHHSGYYVVLIYDKIYLNHRILYQFYNNVILEPTDIVDHADGNRGNNKKENLRITTKSQNAMNQKFGANNKLRHKNIYIIHRKNYDDYRIQITKDGKLVFGKCYRTDKYTLEDVIKIRDAELLKHHGEFMNTGEIRQTL